MFIFWIIFFGQVPFLTAGGDLGYRKVLCDTTTNLSGLVIVQDVQKTNQTYTRQLIFHEMKKHVQSEARIVNGKVVLIVRTFLKLTI